MKSKDSENYKIAVSAVKKAGSVFGIKGMKTSKHAVRLIEHFMTNIGCRSVEELAEQKATGIGAVLFSIGMVIHPDQFGPAAKASTESCGKAPGENKTEYVDDLHMKDAIVSVKGLRAIETRHGLPRDFFIRRVGDLAPHQKENPRPKPKSGSIEAITGGFRHPVMEPQSSYDYVVTDATLTLKKFVEAASILDIIEMQSLYSKSDGPSSVGAEAARKLCAELDQDEYFVTGRIPYKVPWVAICELLSLVGCNMSADQVRQACSSST